MTEPANWQKRATNDAVRAASSLPDLVNKLKVADPELASQLIGKSLLASKSPWGTVMVAAVTWCATHFGFGWDDTTCALVAGGGVLVGSYAMRWITKTPITSVLPTVTPDPVEPTPIPAEPVNKQGEHP